MILQQSNSGNLLYIAVVVFLRHRQSDHLHLISSGYYLRRCENKKSTCLSKGNVKNGFFAKIYFLDVAKYYQLLSRVNAYLEFCVTGRL